MNAPDLKPSAGPLRVLAIAAFAAALAYLLFGEHRVHLLGWAPFLLLLLCPLMHMFLHGDHSRHRPGPDRRTGHSNHRTP